MFGRATITLGIGPHSSCYCVLSSVDGVCCVTVGGGHLLVYGALRRLVHRNHPHT